MRFATTALATVVVLQLFAAASDASEIRFEGVVTNNGLKNIGPLQITADAAGGTLSAIFAGLTQDTLETLDRTNLAEVHLSVTSTGSGNGGLLDTHGGNLDVLFHKATPGPVLALSVRPVPSARGGSHVQPGHRTNPV